jgi:hypothetical protein
MMLHADPVRFSRAAGLIPDQWQEEVLRSPAQRILMCCSRQSGKTSVACVLAAHTATYQDGSLTLIVSPTERQSSEGLMKVRQMLSAVGWPVPAVAEGATYVTLANRSRVVALPGAEATVRGYSACSLLILDEASRIPSELLASLRPVLAVSRGRLIALSTPAGKRGWFWLAWSGDEPYHRVQVTADQCPRITKEFLAAERRALGEAWFAQEYMASFEESATAMFSEEDIQELFTEEIEPWSIEKLMALGRQNQGRR